MLNVLYKGLCISENNRSGILVEQRSGNILKNDPWHCGSFFINELALSTRHMLSPKVIIQYSCLLFIFSSKTNCLYSCAWIGTLRRRVTSMLNPGPKPSKNPNSLPIPVLDAPKRMERCRISSNTNKQVGLDMLPKFSSMSQLGCSFSFSTPIVSATTSRILYAPGCTTQNMSLLSGFPTSFLPSDVSSPKCLAISMGTVSFSSCWNKPASVILPLSACSLSGTAICVDQYIS